MTPEGTHHSSLDRHAGYSYSGPNAAWAYRHLATNANVYVIIRCAQTTDTADSDRVFILGPSHKKYLATCALTPCSSYATPLGNIPVDRTGMDPALLASFSQRLAVIQALTATGLFEQLTKAEDENEHSLEMQLPYLRKIFAKYATFLSLPDSLFTLHGSKEISVVPIMVGRLSTDQQETYS